MRSRTRIPRSHDGRKRQRPGHTRVRGASTFGGVGSVQPAQRDRTGHQDDEDPAQGRNGSRFDNDAEGWCVTHGEVYSAERSAGADRSCRIRRTRRSSHSVCSELGDPFFRSPPGERGVVPFHMPTGLADGLGLESAPGSLWIPAPLVSPRYSSGRHPWVPRSRIVRCETRRSRKALITVAALLPESSGYRNRVGQ